MEPEEPMMLKKKTKGLRRRNSKVVVLQIITFLVFIGVWEWIVYYFDVSSAIFPSATSTISSFLTFFAEDNAAANLWTTFIETITGFILGSISGAVLGILVAEFHWIRKFIMSYIVALNSIPKMALAPLFLIWFGFGMTSKIMLVVVSTFFPVLINMVMGFSEVDESQIKLLRAYSSSSWHIFLRLKLPASLTYLFSGLEIGIVFAVIAAVVSEIIGSGKGLGFMMMDYIYKFQISKMFAVLSIISIMGYLLLLTVQFVSRKVVFWQERFDSIPD
jgi:NitT/TauT family transport system permease protein